MKTKLLLFNLLLFCFLKTQGQQISAVFDNAVKVGDSLMVDVYYKNIFSNNQLHSS